ncbi:serine carboxypeptidase 24-like isoform X2 [Glycine soja]|uniref:serine carboxypeptidase 24-like isoform X2 n=1 Tax=Glycine soja TaxID=3848 RepID=UPI00103FF5BE|nr:serine carboxypeptidase 24-like isoform X2 [Glycine soja]
MMAFQSKAHILFLCLLIFAFSSINILAAAVPKEQEQDRISALPGQPRVAFSQFSGYVTVNEQHGRSLFYWFTESPTSPQNKPLVLWLNGGPGCSSVAYGASEEIGPFRINKTGSSLYLNKYAWNRAQDALIFVIRWMSRFPQYKYREFYIAGESYAGHYVPQLAKKIHDYNKKNPQIINLKGFIVGNAVTDSYNDGIGTVTYWWSHSMISDQSYKSILKYCNFTAEETSKKCDDVYSYAVNYEFGNIDQYSIYTPTCTTSQNNTVRHMRFKNLHLISGYDPCTENYAEKYYNLPEVQIAMHANVTNIPYKWTACSDVLLKNWKDSEISVLPIYKELIAAGLRIWVFSGDTDSVVPVTATRFSLNHLNLRTRTRWYPWYSGGQVGGWTEVYDGLTFATVRGAGHEVPLFQPKRAYILFKSFLAGNELPKY